MEISPFAQALYIAIIPLQQVSDSGMIKLGLAPCRSRDVLGMPGFSMRISDDLRKCVVFLGFEDSPENGGIQCVGTAFLIGYENAGYLVTAKHVADVFSGQPFLVRINKTDGSSENLYGDEVEWTYHQDDTVDIAAIPFHATPGRGFDCLYLPQKMILTNEIIQSEYIGIGDICYTLGLFRLMAGKKKNLPVVHTGNIALVPEDERIPVRDWQDKNKTIYVYGYLVESQSLDGLSGSPVFVRPVIDFEDMRVGNERLPIRWARRDIYILGLWQAAWDAPPGEILAVAHGGQIRVPVGMGVVVPSNKIIELLEAPKLRKQRQQKQQAAAASLDVVRSTKGGNPRHREDFNRLLSEAVKGKRSDG